MKLSDSVNIMLLIKLFCIGLVTGPRFAVLARREAEVQYSRLGQYEST